MLGCRILYRKMSHDALRILNKAEIAENKLAEMKLKLGEIKKIKIHEKITELSKQNRILANKIEAAKSELIKLEILNGKKQIPLPGKNLNSASVGTVPIPQEAPNNAEKPKIKTEKDTTKKNKEKTSTPAQDSVVDVRKLDLRIGKIVDINKHPDADSLYVEKIDCGEETPRTVVSGLVNHVPIGDMQNRTVMVLCNLKPVKMRGVTSEAMVMCASSPEKVEVLIPPSGSVPGDLVSCEGFPREPEPQLNPKKKIFETCAPDLMTNNDKVACYKGSPLVVSGKGPVVAPTLKGVNVK